MNILFVTDPSVSLMQPYAGGTEAFVVDLATELSERGHTIDVVAGAAPENVPFQMKEFEESPYSMRDDIHSEYQGQQIFKSLQYGMMNTDDYDIIHYHSFNPMFYEMGSLHDTPSIVTLHLPPNDELATALNLFQKRNNPLFAAISDRMKHTWGEEILPPSSLRTALNGIDVKQWPMHLRDTNGYILWTGRINAQKNPLDAIKAAQLAGIPIKLAGKIVNQDYFDTEIAPLLSDTVDYVGHLTQDQIKSLIPGAQVYIASALWEEPFGLAVLEMLSSGIPVIGYETAIAPELRNDTCVLATHTHTPESLVSLIQKVSSIDSLACRTFALGFTMKKCATAYELLYKEALKTEKHHD